MPYTNECNIAGHLGSPPIINTTTSGKPVANFSIATNKRRENEESTTWHRCVVWGEPATWTENWQKGDVIEVWGEYTSRKWTNKDGDDQTTFELICRPYFGIRNWTAWKQDREKTGQVAARPKASDVDDLPF